MSVTASIQNFRMNRKVAQEKNNAVQTVTPRVRSTGLPFSIVPFALAFVFALAALVNPVSAAINFTPIVELLEAVVSLIPTMMDLVIAIAPLIVVIAVVGFIVKFLDRILQLLNF